MAQPFPCLPMPAQPTQEQMQALLDDFYEWFVVEKNSRALEGVACAYRTNDGRGCAIGRHIPEEKYDPRIEIAGARAVIAYLHGRLTAEEVSARSANKYSEAQTGISLFYTDLQTLHDYALDRQSSWPDALAKFCKTYNLKNPAEV